MTINTISEAKARLSALVKQALAGEEVIIGKAGKPVVILVPYNGGQERRPGEWRGQIWMADGFDELPAEVTEVFEMGTP